MLSKDQIEYGEKIIESMESMLGIKYSDEQRKVLSTPGSMRIVSCAGSGKTTTIIHMIAKRLKSGEIGNSRAILCSTFSKGGATELEKRLNQLLIDIGYTQPVKVQTLHAFFYNVIRYFGVKSSIISDATANQFIRELLKEAKVDMASYEDVEEVKSMISYQINNVYTCEEMIEHNSCFPENISLDQYKIIYNGYTNKKRAADLIDFDDMQLYLYHWIVAFKDSADEHMRMISSQVLQYCKSMYRYFYIDETQDTSLIQFRIIRELIGKEVVDGDGYKYWDFDGTELVIIGDDDQCIYQWRGAEPEILLENFTVTFDMPTLTLSTNYRCGGNIVEFAEKSIRNNDRRYSKDMKAFKSGGEINLHIAKDELYSMSLDAMTLIKQLINSGVKPKDIAVLSRHNVSLAILHNMLSHEGIRLNSTKDVRFTRTYAYYDIKQALKVLDDNVDNYTATDILWKSVQYLSKSNATIMMKAKNNAGCTFYDFLGYLLKHYLGRNIDYKWPYLKPLKSSVFEKSGWVIKNLSQQQVNEIEFLFDTLRIYKNGEIGADKAFERVCYAIRSDFRYNSPEKMRTSIGYMLYIKSMLEKSSYREVCEYIRICEQVDNSDSGVNGSELTLSTIHGAKGKEWEHVIFFACDTLSTPSFKHIENMRHKNIADAVISKHLDEERRLYYVACTRAINKLNVFTCQNVSPFIFESYEVKYPNEEAGYNDNIVGMIENISSYRETVKKFNTAFNDKSKGECSLKNTTDEKNSVGANES